MIQKVLTNISMVLSLLATAFGAVTIFVAIASGLVPAKYIALLALAILAFDGLSIFFFIKFRARIAMLIVCIVLALIGTVIAAAAFYGVITIEHLISNVTNDSSVTNLRVDQSQQTSFYSLEKHTTPQQVR